MKTAEAESWSVLQSDSTGALMQLHCTCPECDEFLWLSSFISADDLSVVEDDMDFELDIACDQCGKMITVHCAESAYEGPDDWKEDNGI